ncbi:CLUMA_CG012739, isoform A [Clunio marinus]|uniref:CLUMA_CG012739, isoform A n=1 Tax=Clunio marinus TaxID=568069 RepID=A0A1J1IGS8_9DIPT|nr:CLUMA_CG012739, isoform A [Clunio marinus]
MVAKRYNTQKGEQSEAMNYAMRIFKSSLLLLYDLECCKKIQEGIFHRSVIQIAQVLVRTRPDVLHLLMFTPLH